uniref:Ig-like domain-containing protein n=1 Tax=Pygocentrus nattereri TaxID=42514 RepID=A0A3B4D0K7_PYGNA
NLSFHSVWTFCCVALDLLFISFISAEPGKEVTITCTFVNDSSADVRIWYKQRLEHIPLEVGSKCKDKDPVMSPRFKQTRFKIDRIVNVNGISLRIEHVTKEDEGMYFCGLSGQKEMNCSGSELLQDNPFLKSFTLIRTAAAVSVRSALLQAALCMSSLRTSSTSTILELTTVLWLLVGRSFLGMEHQ